MYLAYVEAEKAIKCLPQNQKLILVCRVCRLHVQENFLDDIYNKDNKNSHRCPAGKTDV